MNNRIHGIYGVGFPGANGKKGDEGYDISANTKTTKDGSVLEINLIKDNGQIRTKIDLESLAYKKLQLSSFSTNVYYRNDENETTDKVKYYYQFIYSLNTTKLDKYKIVAYLLFDGTDTYYADSDTSKYITVKDFYEPIYEVESNIKYTDDHKLTKVVVFAFEKYKGYIYNKLYIGEKEF